MTTYFKAEWSNGMKLSTIVLFVVLVGVFFLLFTKVFGAQDSGTKIMAGTVQAVLLATLAFSYLLSPVGYSLDEKSLTIVRPMKPIVIPLTEITKAETVVPALLHGSIRLLGNHGLWGCYGKYSNAALGRYYLYVRSGNDQLLIEAANKYVIAPERPQQFLQSLQRAMAAAKNIGGV